MKTAQKQAKAVGLVESEKLISRTYDYLCPRNFVPTRQMLNDDEPDEISSFIALLPKQKPKVLDAGCGTARLAPFFQSHGADYTGIDISKQSLKIGQMHNRGCNLYYMSMSNITFPQNTFDGLWTMMAMHHTPKKNIGQILSSFLKVLKPGGIGYLLIPAGNQDELVPVPSHPKALTHMSAYSAVEFAIKLRDMGFKILDHEIKNPHVAFFEPNHRFLVTK